MLPSCQFPPNPSSVESIQLNKNPALQQSNEQILKCIWTCKFLRSHQNKFEKAENGDLTLLDFKIYYKTTVTNIAWYPCKSRHLGQQIQQTVQKQSHTYLVIIFDDVPSQFNGDSISFSTEAAENIGQPCAKKHSQLTQHTKLTQRGSIIDLKVNYSAYRRKHERTFWHPGVRNLCLKENIPKSEPLKRKP